MTRFAPRFFRSSLGLVAALGVSANAYAVAPVDLPEPTGECLEDVDCGHGFECQSSITSTIGGGVGGLGGMGGAGGAAGAAGTGTSGTASGGTSAAPRPAQQCGNQLCELPESPTTCPSDCVVYRYCALAECDTTADCAEGYLCEGNGSVGTGGGPSAPVCGDGVCNGAPESEATCPEDCASRSFCTPESGHCTSDGDCATGFYCSFYGSGSGSGGSGVGGSPGTGGSANPGGSAGASTGGAAGTAGRAEGGYASDAPGAEAAPEDTALALGTCMPGGGVGGTGGTGSDASGGVGNVGSGGVGNAGTGGVSTAGTGAASGSGGSSEGGGTGGTGSGEPGTGARTSGGTTSNGGSGTTTGSAGNGGKQPNDDVVVSRGCSVGDGPHPSGFGSLLFAALAFAGLRRRRASTT